MTEPHLDSYYETADSILAAMESKAAGIEWVPSAVARKLRLNANLIRNVLNWMAENQLIAAGGNGRRRRYALKG